MRVEISEYISELYHQAPSSELIREIKAKAEKMGHYTSTEFDKLMNSWREEISSEANKELIEDNNTFLNTVESIKRFAVVSKQEMKNPLEKWQKNSKLAAAEMAKHVMFTANKFKNNPQLLITFWNEIYAPLAMSGGYSETELRRLTSGFMAELAVGESLDHNFNLFRRTDLDVFKGEPAEDVQSGNDLVIKSSIDQSEFPVQIKLQRSNGDTFVNWIKGERDVSQLELYYGRKVEELFNPLTGEPTQELNTLIGSKLLPTFRKKG